MLNLILLLLFAAPQSSVLLQKGLRELQHGDLPSAREDLRKASQEDAKNAFVWSALAEVYAQTHELDLAASAAEQAERNGGDNPMVSHALALYYSQVGQFAKAATSEDRYAASPHADALAKFRTAGWFLASGNNAKALAIAQDVAHTNAQQTFELAQLFLRGQRFADAAELLTTGLQFHPNDPELTLALGVARYGERRFEDAIAAFLQVIHIDPDIDQPYLALGRMLDQAGPHLDEIAADASKWAAKNPTSAQAQLLLAKVLLARDPNERRAEALLRRAIALDAKNWESHYELGVLLEAKHQYALAAEQLRRATELDPKQPNPHYHLARVYDRLGDAQAAAAERDIHKTLTGGGKSE